MDVFVCVGSGCHLKGSYDIIGLFKEAIETHNLSEKVELKASFCLGKCMSGVSIKIADDVITNVNKENFLTVFESKILNQLK